MSAYWKIPLQALILIVGILVFVLYVFQSPPLLWNPAHEQRVRAADSAAYQALETRFADALVTRKAAALQIGRPSFNANAPEARQAIAAFRAADARVSAVRDEALASAGKVTAEPTLDVNYIIPRFVLNELPIGLAGLFIAAVLGAAMAASSAELSSLSTATVIDFYRRWVKPEAPDAHYLAVSKAAIMFWGVFACFVATFAATLGSLIEVVNRFGSFFYGSILGVFLLAMIPRARARGAFFGMIAGMTAVGAVTFGAPSVKFLWLNVVGAGVVVGIGMAISAVSAKPANAGA
jgi:Na+(H+)/acetate symporter ActP